MTTPTDTTLPEAEHEAEVASGPVLIPVLGYRCALKLSHLGVTFLLGLLLVFHNYLPLRGTDLWGHVLYGRWIAEHRLLPTEDPFLPLAQGMRVVDTAWLSQLLLAQVDRLGGAEALSNLFAFVVWFTFIIFARTFFLQSRSKLVMLIGVAMTLAVGWSRVTTIRPEIFSLLCLATLFWLLTRRQVRATTDNTDATAADSSDFTPGVLLWVALPLLFALWANLHGTFVGGLLVLGCYTIGRGFDVLLAERSLKAVFADRAFRSWLVLAEVATAATLINPYGVDLWIEVARFGFNPVLRDVSEWMPMVMLGIAGREFVAGCIVLVFALRLSRRPMPARETFMLLVFGLLAMMQVRMVGWFAPVLSFVLVPHLANIFARWMPAEVDEAALAATLPADELPPGRSFRYTLICATVAWVMFAFTGIGGWVLGSPARKEANVLGDTPLAMTKALRESPPVGQVYNPQWWGDWLAYSGPADLKLFMTTNMHLIPRQVWNDYRRITAGESGFDAALDRYRINTLIVDKQAQPVLAGAAIRLSGWGIRYEDEQSLVMSRLPKANGAKVAAHSK